MELAGIVGAVLLGGLTAFQLGLAAGAPWGAAAWGGRHPGVLPSRLRVGSAVVGIVVYPLAILVLLVAAGVWDLSWPNSGKTTLFVITGFFALGTLLNLVSRSPVERLWAVPALGIAICFAIVATAM